MRLSGIRYIYAARLEARAVLVQEVFAILGIAVGVALLFASQVASTSLSRSVAQLSSQFVGSAQFQLEQRGPEGFPERLLGEVRRIPGVQVALPITESQVNVIGKGEQPIDLIGVEPQSVSASGPLLRRFSAKQIAAQKAIALPAPLANEIGASPFVVVKLQFGSEYVETLVGATLGEPEVGALVHSPIAVAPIRYAQRLAGAPATLSRIIIHTTRAQAPAVSRALLRLADSSHVNLVPGDFDAKLFDVAVLPQSESEELFSGISAIVGFMFALNAMLITVPSRRKLIEDLRPHGATRLMTLQILMFDAAVIGVIACILGLLLGDGLSIAVFHTTPGYLAFAFPIGNIRIVTWQSIALAVAAGMLASIVGVLWPVREFLRESRAATGASHQMGRRLVRARLAIGVLCIVLTTMTVLLDPKDAIVGNIALFLALVCLLPFLFDALVARFGVIAGHLDGIGMALAVTELQTPQTRVRSLAIAATAAVAVFGIVEFQGTQTNLKAGLDASARNLDSAADIWVVPSGRSSLLTTVSFNPDADQSTLQRVPGVRSVGLFRGSFLNWGDRRLWVRAPATDTPNLVPSSQLIQGSLPLVSKRVESGEWAVLSQALANEHHLTVGEAFTLPSPRPQTFRVAALTTNLGWPPGAIVISSAAYARAWLSSQPSALQIQTIPGVSVGHTRALVQAALRLQPGLTVETAPERESRHYALAAQGLSRLTQIRLLVLFAAILAIVGAMGSMLWQRRERIAFHKCNGFREGMLWRSLVCESAVLLGAGSAIGAVFGLYAQILASHILSAGTGFPITFGIEAIAAFTSFGLVTILAVAILALAGYPVVRVQPSTVNQRY